MGLKKDTRTIGATFNAKGEPVSPGFRVTVTQFPLSIGLDVLARIVECAPERLNLSPGAGPQVSAQSFPGVPATAREVPQTAKALSQKVQGGGGGGDEFLSLMYQFIRGILSNPEALRYFREQFGAFTTVQVPAKKGTAEEGFTLDVQDSVLGADYAALFEFLYFAAIHNFGSLWNLMPQEGKEAVSVVAGRATDAT